MSSENPTLENQGGLKKSLKLIYVYAIATGAIFTFVGYWDSIFYSYCGPATFLAFLLIVCCVLPIAFVYCELSPLFPTCGGELIYNTVGFNKHVGFFSSWLIMGAWIAVIPAAIMAIIQWISKVCGLALNFQNIVIIGIIILSGTSVNNYILITDSLAASRGEGSFLERVKAALADRFNPLFLSCGTSVIASVPILFSARPFSDFPSALAVIITLGILGSFVGSFLFLPAIVDCFIKEKREA